MQGTCTYKLELQNASNYSGQTLGCEKAPVINIKAKAAVWLVNDINMLGAVSAISPIVPN